jgi:hypothetical protein
MGCSREKKRLTVKALVLQPRETLLRRLMVYRSEPLWEQTPVND